MKKSWQKSFLYVFPFLISFLLISWGIYFFMSETEKDITTQSKQYLTEISQQRAAAVQSLVNQNFDKLSAISQILSNDGNLSEDNIMKILSAEAARSDYKRMGLAALDGEAITTDLERFSISDRSYFQKAVKGENGLSDKLTDKVDGKDINVYAVPLYQGEEIYGVIFATCTTESFSEILSTPVFGQDGYTYIVTQSGDPIVYIKKNDKSVPFKNLFDEITADDNDMALMRQNMSEGKTGTIEYNKHETNNIAAYFKVGINDWYLVSVVPENIISQSVSKIIYRNASSALIIAIVLFCLVAFILHQQKKTTHKFERIAYFDELIGFPNYNSFLEKSKNILKANLDKQYVFVMLDVNNFKMINAQFGFELGNLILKNIALAISNICTEPDELFARLPVDKYILMLNYKDAQYLKNMRKDFKRIFEALMGEDFKWYMKFPTGRYIADKGETDIDDIFEKVNYAHQRAKLLVNEKNGIDEFFYDNKEKENALHRIDIENRMHDAIDKKEFKVFLQPKYQLTDEAIVGAEALVRWQDADGKLMPPSDFIPLFEQNGFIVKLDMYMFQQVCSILKEWIDRGSLIVPVSVNFSRLHLLDPNFIKNIVAITDLYHIPRKYIEIELTESVIFENENLIIDVLQEAHQYGFLLSMDDFGSGYSSLGLLKNIPVDVIKIDRSFFVNIKDDGQAKAIIEVIMLMAQKLKIRTVAEGIEKADQISFLKEIKCDIVQGFYYAKPMPLDEFNEVVNRKIAAD